MEIPFGRMQATKVGTAVEEAIAELGIVFPPPRTKISEKALEKHRAGTYGVTTSNGGLQQGKRV